MVTSLKEVLVGAKEAAFSVVLLLASASFNPAFVHKTLVMLLFGAAIIYVYVWWTKFMVPFMESNDEEADDAPRETTEQHPAPAGSGGG